MKRVHVHVAVEDLAESIRFYRTLFAAEPSVLKPDYAKWMLDDPRLNFAISERAGAPGIEHLGIQVEAQDELQEVYGRLRAADQPLFEEGTTTCCYASSEKSWISDPQGVIWETFLTTGEHTRYGHDPDLSSIVSGNACCTAETPQGACCAPENELAPGAACCG